MPATAPPSNPTTNIERSIPVDHVRHFSQKQLARRWGLSTRCLERWRAAGAGPHFLTFGRRVLYRLSDVEAFEANHLHECNDTRLSKPARAPSMSNGVSP